ncbi:phosphatase PAP2 family protein [Maribacter sp. 2210JD10-5]|uniref:phosphatase PAP2 family protein n=1 Tax=Maribacter sp. 2210JD10-5 TaxID=3386272 RepID=UPI0039BD5115
MNTTFLTYINRLRNGLSTLTKRHHRRLPYFITAMTSLVIVLVGIKLFVELTKTLQTDTLANFDKNITDFFISMRSPALTGYFKFVTDIGDVSGYLVVLAICTVLSIIVFKNWKFIVQIVLVLALATLSNIVLKKIINRARPGIEHLVTVKTLSYPSGHAMSAMAFYGFLVYLVHRLKIHRLWKTLIIALLTILIISIGTSRIYLGVHFPSDVIGGFIAGIIWICFCVLIFNLVETFRQDPKT